jgi:hypothetical protein
MSPYGTAGVTVRDSALHNLRDHDAVQERAWKCFVTVFEERRLAKRLGAAIFQPLDAASTGRDSR